jgi:fibronectin-binding autotransporter adhesin
MRHEHSSRGRSSLVPMSQTARAAKRRNAATRRAAAMVVESLEVRQFLTAVTWNPQTPDRTWDVGVTANGLDPSNNQVVFHNGDSVTFGGTVGGAVNIAGTVAPSLTTVSSGSNYDLGGSGSIAGAGSLTKAGAGTLTLSGTAPNAFTGPTALNDGTLVLDKTDGVNALVGGGGGLSAVEVNNGATLRWDSSDQIADAQSVHVFDGTVNLNGQRELMTGLASDRTGSVVRTGTGTMVLTGSLLENLGTVTVDAGGIINASQMNVGSGGAAVLNVAGLLSLGAGGTSAITGLGGSGLTAFVTVQSGGELRTSGSLLSIQGPNTVVQAGAALSIGSGGFSMVNATLTVQSDATNPGRINMGGDYSGGGAGGAVILNGGAGALPAIIDIGAATRSFNVTSGFIRVDPAIQGTGGVNKDGPGAISFTGANS